jgi:flagellar basal-body rod protein FlgB
MTPVPILQLLEGYLGVAYSRHQLIVSNMANIDTPGYHTQDIDFRSELHKAIDSSGAALSPAVHSVPGLLQRPDGNDVNLDRESLLLAETQMQYQIGVQIMKSEFHRLLTAINEGK